MSVALFVPWFRAEFDLDLSFLDGWLDKLDNFRELINYLLNSMRGYTWLWKISRKKQAY